MLDSSRYRSLLCCPICSDAVLDEESRCPHCGFVPRYVDGQPVLIDAAHSIVDPEAVAAATATSASVLHRMADRLAPRNGTAARVVDALLAMVRRREPANRLVLVVGGGTRGSGLEALYDAPDVDVLAFDIYPSPNTQFVADGHRIPLPAQSVDAVVVQAVLEHVLDPWAVVAEIHRVLRDDGLVYADTPFLQHVHEGPFDFTRFTESGHRWLFRRFVLLDAGVVAGPGTVLAWSLAQAARALIPLRGISSAVRLASRPVAALIDRAGAARPSIDGASSVYFFGIKSTTELKPREIVAYYRGEQSKQLQRTT